MRTINCLADAFEAPAAALVLDPNASVRDRVALAVLSCSEETLKHVAKLLDVE